jgi:hypothetical protein
MPKSATPLRTALELMLTLPLIVALYLMLIVWSLVLFVGNTITKTRGTRIW